MHECLVKVKKQSIFAVGDVMEIGRRTSLQKLDAPTMPILAYEASRIVL